MVLHCSKGTDLIRLLAFKCQTSGGHSQLSGHELRLPGLQESDLQRVRRAEGIRSCPFRRGGEACWFVQRAFTIRSCGRMCVFGHVPSKRVLPLQGHVVSSHEPSKCICSHKRSGDPAPDLVTAFSALPKPGRYTAVFPPTVVPCVLAA